MSRFACLFGAVLSLALSGPALAQSSRPAKTPAPTKKDTKKTPAKKKVTLTKDASFKLALAFATALEKKKAADAAAMCEAPFLHVVKGKVVKLDAKALTAALKGKLGQQLAKHAAALRNTDAKKDGAFYWGPKSKRAMAAKKRHKELTACGYVGVLPAGKAKKAEEAKAPLVIKLVKGKLRIVGFVDE